METADQQALAESVRAGKAAKQAVVIIHGMGEQRPMETLRSFVKAVWETDSAIAVEDRYIGDGDERYRYNTVWMAPDTKTGSTELDRMTTGPTKSGYRVDFFEFYWADIMTGTTLQHLQAWASGLLFRWPMNVPRRVFAVWVALWVTLLLVLAGLSYAAASTLGLGEWFGRAMAGLTEWLGFELPEECLAQTGGTANIMTCPLHVLVSGWHLVAIALGILSAIVALLLLWWSFHAGYQQAGDERTFGRALLSYLFLLAIPLAVGGAVYAFIWQSAPAGLLSAFAVGLGLLVNAFLLPIFGDVARYVHPAPGNVQKRAAVRERGLKLLRALHGVDAKGKPIIGADGKPTTSYQRIIIVGHSLGSIIAYDLITKFWAEAGPIKNNDLDDQSRTLLRALERKIGTGEASDLDVSRYQRRQRAVSRSIVRHGGSWKISDFVTVGSPLSHADFLLARTRQQFDRLVQERLVSKCPPFPYEDGLSRLFYPFDSDWGDDPDAKKRDATLSALHHATAFSVVRWTNIYDQSRAILLGDVISGTVSKFFGDGIREIQVAIGQRDGWSPFRRFFTHTDYWNIERDGRIVDDTAPPRQKPPYDPHAYPVGEHVEALRHAIALDAFDPTKYRRP